ncbi:MULTISPECIES: DUF4350 domain-containing protein [Halomicrobium]|uniref:DUF4350 domain-containing protein n=2 Tax=Halomicrobium mukohataei TaxID=57705 RepID=C7NW94_HALMD|nr:MULTISPECIES: DUF4350 domain-containing protein [Halomicrobium]ACV46235.1 conserved hypothetical protein [Halomicrobium mukohataei DSM 12286]QCD64796.1 DUF4350 domain-containing protein [Halomicrobium mukohataei]QFR19603.1 DUF4350 domain-containing protein [Halomicrobium sp. ZPS1]
MAVDYPRVVLAGFAVVVTLGLLVAGSTSGGAFGSYNPAWDGTSEFRSLAADDAEELSIGQNTSVYDPADAEGTLAVILSPAEQYSERERRSIRRFVEAGGTLLVAEDVGPNGNRLLRSVGAQTRFDGASLRDERRYENGPALPVATAVGLDNDSVETIVLNHGTAVRAAGTTDTGAPNETMRAVRATNATVLAASSPYAYLDRNGNEELDDDETVARYPVATAERVGEGRVIAVSDPSVFINAMLERGDNRAFSHALLAGSDTVVLDVSHAGSLPPLQALVLSLRGSALLQAVVGTALLGVLAGHVALLDAVSALRRRFGSDDPARPPRDRAAIVRGVTARHPEWDAERVERVTQAIMERRAEGDGND